MRTHTHSLTRCVVTECGCQARNVDARARALTCVRVLWRIHVIGVLACAMQFSYNQQLSLDCRSSNEPILCDQGNPEKTAAARKKLASPIGVRIDVIRAQHSYAYESRCVHCQLFHVQVCLDCSRYAATCPTMTAE